MLPRLIGTLVLSELSGRIRIYIKYTKFILQETCKLAFATHISDRALQKQVLFKKDIKMIYLNALVGTLFLTLEAGVFLEGLTWMGLNALHASQSVIMGGEAFMMIPLAILFFFVFNNALSAEKDILEGKL